MRRSFLDCICCFCAFRVIANFIRPFLFVKRLFLAVIFSAK
ncbi:membrane protein [Helicobacter pylori]|uniref:Uncharacterized protein n=1 Tax=Helicobacter pylori ELS37 TaxID=1055527 RepID=A0ABC7ZHH6_HELPX|nr:hypothetical protein HPELS_07385 [Helicobacter pylori ELS37]KHL81802.1 membrane protein [Helicobacter pylori]